jgi:DNA helicase-2/ATP-dependent DNA helicase PcrA
LLQVQVPVKRSVITFRVAHLIQTGVDPFNILVLTFTNKASKDMRERIGKVVGAEAKNIWMGTFHSVFAKILRVEAEKSVIRAILPFTIPMIVKV